MENWDFEASNLFANKENEASASKGKEKIVDE
ncbi:hypothetical protein ES332_A12G202900v1 [Gossypium tomentosum]|uniref:Uncharacterized protein n=1 Tax=Gossypium tomentosum TaxID=34277 RepID=A0A5D2N211_GOSTO|nr:hypothetical protein ES332_A12G202900v1 [Gossypium tomentosum]